MRRGMSLRWLTCRFSEITDYALSLDLTPESIDLTSLDVNAEIGICRNEDPGADPDDRGYSPLRKKPKKNNTHKLEIWYTDREPTIPLLHHLVRKGILT